MTRNLRLRVAGFKNHRFRVKLTRNNFKIRIKSTRQDSKCQFKHRHQRLTRLDAFSSCRGGPITVSLSVTRTSLSHIARLGGDPNPDFQVQCVDLAATLVAANEHCTVSHSPAARHRDTAAGTRPAGGTGACAPFAKRKSWIRACHSHSAQRCCMGQRLKITRPSEKLCAARGRCPTTGRASVGHRRPALHGRCGQCTRKIAVILKMNQSADVHSFR